MNNCQLIKGRYCNMYSSAQQALPNPTRLLAVISQFMHCPFLILYFFGLVILSTVELSSARVDLKGFRA